MTGRWVFDNDALDILQESGVTENCEFTTLIKGTTILTHWTGINLLYRSVQLQPQDRISANEALDHPWFHA